MDLDAGELRKQGVRLQLQPKPFQMLAILLERPGEVVTRDELRRRLWDGDTFVDYESGLNTAANRLRLKLGDSAETPRYIETLARTGYRFIAPIERIDWVPPSSPPPSPILPPVEPRRAVWRLPWYLVAAAIAIAVLTYFVSRPSTPSRVRFRQLTFRRGQVLGARFAPDIVPPEESRASSPLRDTEASVRSWKPRTRDSGLFLPVRKSRRGSRSHCAV